MKNLFQAAFAFLLLTWSTGCNDPERLHTITFGDPSLYVICFGVLTTNAGFPQLEGVIREEHYSVSRVKFSPQVLCVVHFLEVDSISRLSAQGLSGQERVARFIRDLHEEGPSVLKSTVETGPDGRIMFEIVRGEGTIRQMYTTGVCITQDRKQWWVTASANYWDEGECEGVIRPLRSQKLKPASSKT